MPKHFRVTCEVAEKVPEGMLKEEVASSLGNFFFPNTVTLGHTHDLKLHGQHFSKLLM
jgi:hypothetical protein